LKREYGGHLLVDEAHSMGVLGTHGRGAAEAAGVESEIDFIAGTFSKSLGSTGGYCVSRHPELETIRYCIRSYIFTASSSPMMVASTRKALQILQSEPGLRRQLWDNAERLYSGLQALGLPIGPSPGPVVTVSLEDRSRAINCWNALMEAGIYVNLVVPPASPSTNFLLRNSVSAAHSSAQIDAIIATYAGLVDAGLIVAKQDG
jgi:8-amino-7-oxononanoate synthase